MMTIQTWSLVLLLVRGFEMCLLESVPTRYVAVQ
jgi:hypothetical protein